MTEEKSSKLIRDRVDLKALTIKSLQFTFEAINKEKIEGIAASDKLEIVYLTNFGFVTGEYVHIKDALEFPEDGQYNKYLFANTLKNRNLLLAEYEKKNDNLRLTSDSSLIYLRNAIVRPFTNLNSSVRFGDLFLFTDQIIGISAKGSSESM